MVRSIPEKTFEHWASMYVANRFPLSSLWWPTFGEDVRVEDLGTVPGKTLYLEVKVPEQQANGSHRTIIDIPQLQRYLTSPVPVFYVFPTPPWRGDLATSAWLRPERRADLAYRRAGHRWFGDWTRVCTAAALHRHLNPAGQTNMTLAGLPPGYWDWPDFWSEFRDCGSASLPSAFILDDVMVPGEAPAPDGPTPDGPTPGGPGPGGPEPDGLARAGRGSTVSRSVLRGHLKALRQRREVERRDGRDDPLESHRGKQPFVYVPSDPSSESEQYRLVPEDELSEHLTALLTHETRAPGEPDADHLAICHAPFTVLN